MSADRLLTIRRLLEEMRDRGIRVDVHADMEGDARRALDAIDADPWASLFAEVRAELGTLITRSGDLSECDADDPLMVLREEARMLAAAHRRGDAEATRAAALTVAAWAIASLRALDREAHRG